MADSMDEGDVYGGGGGVVPSSTYSAPARVEGLAGLGRHHHHTIPPTSTPTVAGPLTPGLTPGLTPAGVAGAEAGGGVASGAGTGAGAGAGVGADDAHPQHKFPVTVEICLKSTSIARPGDVKAAVKTLLESTVAVYSDGPIEFSSDPFLVENVQSVTVCDLGDSPRVHGPMSFMHVLLRLCVFQLNEDGVSEETTDGDEDTTACSQWVLPAAEFDGLWESLVYDIGIKSTLLEYASTALLFADKGVDSNIISWNRVVLLHGPPGTGKTSLCKALAQKLAIRLGDRYPNGVLLEINAHSLFSKWFSESGKLVMRLFQHIRELVDGEDALVCVLIDEVESLTAARKSALSGSEPSDAVRVVNALLTQIDALRSMDNVIILTTSNITEAIDVAFVDRADIKQYIGLPSHRARYDIIRSCALELMRVGIVTPSVPIPKFEEMAKHAADGIPVSSAASSLYSAAANAEGMSGRALRKLPFQAHAFFLQEPATTPEAFAAAVDHAVMKELANRSALATG